MRCWSFGCAQHAIAGSNYCGVHSSSGRPFDGVGSTTAAVLRDLQEEEEVPIVKVPGTGLTYRDADEALVAADEIEHDGVRVHDLALMEGLPEKAEQALEQSRDLAEKIRGVAGDGEPEEDQKPKHNRTRWTREKIVAAIREVAAKVDGTPSRSDMAKAGYASATQTGTTERLGTTFAELVVEAGFEPRTRADNRQKKRAHKTGPNKSKDPVPVRKKPDPVRKPIVWTEYHEQAAGLEADAAALEERAARLRAIATELRDLGAAA